MQERIAGVLLFQSLGVGARIENLGQHTVEQRFGVGHPVQFVRRDAWLVALDLDRAQLDVGIVEPLGIEH